MESDASYIDSGGCSISLPGKSVKISWGSYPHFYKKDTLIISYIGTNEAILEFLNQNYGPQFAGFETHNQ